MGGDYDPVTGDDVRRLVASHRRRGAAATIASTVLDDPGGYGRVVRKGSRLVEVVEDVDASPRSGRSVRPRSCCSRSGGARCSPRCPARPEEPPARVLPEPGDPDDARGREKVNVVPVDTGGAMGVNSRAGLAAVEAVARGGSTPATWRTGSHWSTAGHLHRRRRRDRRRFRDLPEHVPRARVPCRCACGIGPSVAISDSRIGDGSVVQFSVLQGAQVGRGCEVGTVRPSAEGAVLDDGAEVGNYVEVKATRLGRGAKAKHLIYLGDAEIGDCANIGAGTVTVNYDGYAEHPTVVGDGARIGSIRCWWRRSRSAGTPARGQDR